MSLVRTLRILASQRPTTPSRAVATPERVQRRRHGGVPVTWIDEHLAGQGVIVHLHGGSYLEGEKPAHWEWLEEVARRSGTAAAMIHYRLAPRHPFPAAVEDVLHALDAMVEETLLRPGRWILSGDEAGAGLALAVARTLAPSDAPAGLELAAPWADLLPHLAAPTDLGTAARLYAGAVPGENVRLSPLRGDLSGLPPVHLVVGASEPLAGDARRLHTAVQVAGGESALEEIASSGDDRAADGLAVHGRGAAAQEARRAQIVAIRAVLGLDPVRAD